MSHLEANPHAAELIAHRNRGNVLSPTVEATLALAYEQRTTTMAILAGINPEWYGSVGPGEFAEIAARMGKGPEATK